MYPLATRDHYGADIYNPNTGVVCLGGLNGAPKDCGVDVGNGNWGPRIGLAYRFNEKTVIRAGYGISVDPNSYRAMRDAYPATIGESISGATSFQAAGTLATGIPAIVGPNLSGNAPIILPTTITTTTYPMHYKRGYIESLNVTIERELSKDFTAQAAFVSTKAIRHTDDININDLATVIKRKYGKAKGVYVRADKETIWDPIAQVTAELGAANFQVNMVTQPEDSSSRGAK